MSVARKFKYVIFDSFHGNHWGTDDKGIAREHSMCEEFSVLVIEDDGSVSSLIADFDDEDSATYREVEVSSYDEVHCV